METRQEDNLEERLIPPEIYCTLGNTTNTAEIISSMIKAGMRGARINTAYCNFEQYTNWIDLVREESAKENVSVPIMMDIKGPQLRILTAKPDTKYTIEKDTVFQLGFYDSSSEEDFVPDENIDIYVNHDIKKDLKEGDILLFENGTISACVVENNKGTHIRVLKSGEGYLQNKMGLNIPRKYLDVPHLSEKDKRVIDYCLEHKIDKITLSFVRDSKDVENFQKYMREKIVERGGDHWPILSAKIEDKFGYTNLTEVIDSMNTNLFDWEVMIARGDLFTELNYAHLARIQQTISDTCKDKKIPFMIGTGLLESMKYHPRPTRAEVGDVWNSLREKPDYLMMSAETSNSKYPVLAVNTLKGIVGEYYRK